MLHAEYQNAFFLSPRAVRFLISKAILSSNLKSSLNQEQCIAVVNRAHVYVVLLSSTKEYTKLQFDGKIYI